MHTLVAGLSERCTVTYILVCAALGYVSKSARYSCGKVVRHLLRVVTVECIAIPFVVARREEVRPQPSYEQLERVCDQHRPQHRCHCK